jgi:GntR family transcriptional repressor for pyruvate dehydrogenase complex
MSKLPGVAHPSRAYEQLAGALRTKILDGELAEGGRLQSEAALGREWGVSRPTVREALRVLQESGYIERASPKILVVRRHSEHPAFREMTHALRRRRVTFRSVHEALMTLEPELTRMAAEHRDEGDLAALAALIERQRAGRADFPLWCRLDDDFHLAVAEAGGNAPLILARASLSEVVVPATRQFIHDARAVDAAIDFHVRILEEIERGDGEGAAFMARRHITDFREAWEHSGLDYERELGEMIDSGGTTILAP